MKTRILDSKSSRGFCLVAGWALALSGAGVLVANPASAKALQKTHPKTGVATSASTAVSAKADAPSSVIVTARIFPLKGKRTNPLFIMKREESADGNKSVITETFTDPQGNVALQSETHLDGNRFVSYQLDQKQLHEKAKIKAKNGKIHFEYTDASGKVKKDDEDWDDRFVVAPMLGQFFKAHWQEILNGKSVDMRFGVPERQESVGFEVFKDGEKKINGRDVVIAKMKPSSFIIAALVDPLYFYFDKSNARLLEIRGRTLPKRRDGNDWKDLDADSIYSY